MPLWPCLGPLLKCGAYKRNAAWSLLLRFSVAQFKSRDLLLQARKRASNTKRLAGLIHFFPKKQRSRGSKHGLYFLPLWARVALWQPHCYPPRSSLIIAVLVKHLEIPMLQTTFPSKPQCRCLHTARYNASIEDCSIGRTCIDASLGSETLDPICK